MVWKTEVRMSAAEAAPRTRRWVWLRWTRMPVLVSRKTVERACWVKFGRVEARPGVWVNQASPAVPSAMAGRLWGVGGSAGGAGAVAEAGVGAGETAGR